MSTKTKIILQHCWSQRKEITWIDISKRDAELTKSVNTMDYYTVLKNQVDLHVAARNEV